LDADVGRDGVPIGATGESAFASTAGPHRLATADI
jgi:hypothetical protein